MCEFCSNDPAEKERAVKKAKAMADRLGKLSKAYEDLAYFKVRPHEESWMRNDASVRLLIRDLVEDWI